MKKHFFSIKDIVYIIIILFLIVMLILSKKDLDANILNKDNWIDIILNGISILFSTILSVLIIWQGFKLNKHSEKLEIDTFNKQIDLDLRDRRLEIFKTFESSLYKLDNKDFFISSFISMNYDKLDRRFNSIVEKENELISAYCEAKFIFKDNVELLELLEEFLSMFSNYCEKLQTFWGDMYKANDEAIIMLRKDGLLSATKYIPKELIDTDYKKYKKCVSIFEKYYSSVIEEELKIVDFLSSEKFNKAFEKDINIEKIKEV